MKPRIAIVGAGAVGCYYGGRLAQHGHDVHFLLRSDYDAVTKGGLQIRSPLGNAKIFPIQTYRRTSDIGPCDVVFISLKATSNRALLDLLPPLLGDGTVLVTLQNGLGNEEFLSRHFGAERVLGGLCFVCINRVEPGVIDHIAQGRIDLGEHERAPLARTYGIGDLLRASGVDCDVVGSLAAARWKKLVWNIPFNGLAIAAGGIDTAAILAEPRLLKRVRDLMTEIITTAEALGHHVAAGLAEDMIDRTRTMTRYKPSSLIDFEAGREVELEPIWGEPIRRAAAAGLRMPLVEDLYAELQDRLSIRTS
jgi:2-dehydropantoate 2-reductase